MKTITAGDLSIAYHDDGPRDGPVVLLLHGWPDDPSTWDEVKPALHAAGLRTIAPALRGFGQTRFATSEAPRTGNSAIHAIDQIALIDALGIERFSVAGHDWGSNIAEALAVGWPDRVERIAMLATPPRLGGMPTPPFWHAQLQWYHWFMATARGAAAIAEDRRGFAERHWRNWGSPGWYDEATFSRVARAWDNPDWIAVTLHSYRSRWDEAEPDPRSRWLEDKVKETASLSLPAVYIQGGIDGVNPPAAAKAVPGKFSGPFALVQVHGAGHFIQRERPDAVADVLVALFTGQPLDRLADVPAAALTHQQDGRRARNRKRLIWALGAAGLAAAVVGGSAAAQTGRGGSDLTPVAQFGHQATGVAVTTDGRRFVNFPRWTDDAPVSVAEVMRDGSLRPYPDARWNGWRNARAGELPVGEYFVCVQSIVPDGHGNLWVVDPGAPGNEKILPGAPKLVRIDLASNQVTKVIAVPDDVALQGSYLNDIRFSPDGRIGYITDSGTKGAIIVVDLATGKSRRTLDGQPSTQVDRTVTVTLDGRPLRRPDGRQPAFAADGIAISNDGRTLYWQALTGKTLYSIDTALLRDGVSELDRARAVTPVATTQVTDGLWMSKAGTLYLTSPSDYSIKRLNGSRVETVLTDRRLRWPDTFAEGPDGRMYVTASHIQDTVWFTPGAPPSIRTQLFSFAPAR